MSIQFAPCFLQRREGILQFSAPASLISILHQAQDLVLAIEDGVCLLAAYAFQEATQQPDTVNKQRKPYKMKSNPRLKAKVCHKACKGQGSCVGPWEACRQD